MNKISFKTRSEFRDWLANNALSDIGIWLVFGKKGGPNTISASEALEEALCFGWIDSQIQSVDDKTYLKYFKQRGKTSNWSEVNRKLVDKLEAEGRMTDFGRAKMEAAKLNGHWDPPKPDPLTDEQMRCFEEMLKAHETAYSNFMKLPRSARGAYASSWFFGTKTEAGKRKRFDTIVERLNLNLNPMESMKKAVNQDKGLEG